MKCCLWFYDMLPLNMNKIRLLVVVLLSCIWSWNVHKGFKSEHDMFIEKISFLNVFKCFSCICMHTYYIRFVLTHISPIFYTKSMFGPLRWLYSFLEETLICIHKLVSPQVQWRICLILILLPLSLLKNYMVIRTIRLVDKRNKIQFSNSYVSMENLRHVSFYLNAWSDVKFQMKTL